MVWPLVMRGRLLRRIAWMGDPVSQYGDVLLEDGPERDKDLTCGLDAIRSLGVDLLHMRKVRMDSHAAYALNLFGATFAASDAAPYLQLSSARTFAEYGMRYPSKLRSTRRRYARRLQGEGHVSFEQHDAGAQASALAGQAIRHKKAWAHKHAVIAPTLTDARFEAFFADVSAGLSRPVDLRVVAVRCGGRVAGVEISLVNKRHLFGHVIAHDPAFEKKGIGSVLAEHAIRSAHDSGFDVYDLLAPADSYKAEWADGSMAVVDFVNPLTIAGRVHASLWVRGLRPYAKRRIDNAPVWVGRIFESLSGARASAELSRMIPSRLRKSRADQPSNVSAGV
jgi:CelD/BcsL family acetyltransferase involved in cellulose biosynthesis